MAWRGTGRPADHGQLINASESTSVNRRSETGELDDVAARYHVEDQQGQGDEEQDVDHAAGDVETESHQPQDQKDCEQRPKHRLPLAQYSLSSAADPWLPRESSRQPWGERSLCPGASGA